MKKDLIIVLKFGKAVIIVAIILLMVYFLSGCQKEASLLPVFTPATSKHLSDKIKTTTIITDTYNSSYFDSCRKENIILSGSVTYTTKLTQDTSGNISLSYDIDLTATGKGEITGHIFKGGITLKGNVRQSSDGTYKSISNYKLRFVGDNGDQITFNESIKFVYIDGEAKLFFASFSDSCK